MFWARKDDEKFFGTAILPTPTLLVTDTLHFTYSEQINSADTKLIFIYMGEDL